MHKQPQTQQTMKLELDFVDKEMNTCLYNFWPDWRIPPAPGTNQIAGFVEYRPLTNKEKNN